MSTQSLPANELAERTVLGAILVQDALYMQAAGVLEPGDFILEKHRRIFRRMGELHQRGDKIDRVTLATELMQHGELESCDGLAYLVSLDDTMPKLPNIDSYTAIVKDNALLRKIVFTAQHLMNRAMVGEDRPEQIVADASKQLRDLSNPAHQSAETIDEIISEAGGVEEFFKGAKGIPTPWPNVTRCLGGWNAHELIVVAARPSTGKTALALNAAWGAACQGIPSAFYSLEMGKRQIVLRQISYLTGIVFNDIQQGTLSKVERYRINEALDQIRERPIRFIDAAGKGPLWVRSHAERLHAKGGLGFVAVDYLGLFPCSQEKNRVHELGDHAKEMKLLAKSLGIPVMLLAQLNRNSENRTDKRPVLADLRDSGEIEEHADSVAFIHRPERYAPDDESLRGKAEFIIAKQRNGGVLTLDLRFRGETFRFEAETEEEH
jgi:replicative DNA helicase